MLGEAEHRAGPVILGVAHADLAAVECDLHATDIVAVVGLLVKSWASCSSVITPVALTIRLG